MVAADPILKALIDILPDDKYYSVVSLNELLDQNVSGYLNRPGIANKLAYAFGMHVERHTLPGARANSPPPLYSNFEANFDLGLDEGVDEAALFDFLNA